jgi:Tol biopolymer transport system component
LPACSSKKKNSDDATRELVHFDSLEGEVHQLTTVGSNSQISFSPIFNKLLLVRNNPLIHKTPQIYIKNMIDKTERRLTYNIGENMYPKFHPFKNWVAYSSTTDETTEKINVEPVMKDLGLKKDVDPKAAVVAPPLPLEIYISNEDGSDIKRITRNKGFDSLANFSRDGEKIIYVTQSGPHMVIMQQHMNSAQKRILFQSTDPITSLSLSDELMAFTTDKKLYVKKIKNQETVYESTGEFSFADVDVLPKEKRLLVISNFEDKKNKDVYELDLEKKCTIRLTFHPGDESSPSFGPEGKSFFFVSNRSQTNQVYATLIRPTLPCKSW